MRIMMNKRETVILYAYNASRKQKRQHPIRHTQPVPSLSKKIPGLA